MSPSIFTYDLPQDRIAQRPVYPYDAAKLLVIDRKSGGIKESQFSQIDNYLSPSDLLFFNNSAVIPARVFARKRDTGAQGELLFLESSAAEEVLVLAKPIKKFTENSIFDLDQTYSLKIISRISAKELKVLCLKNNNPCSSKELLAAIGVMPIPPYIRSGRGDIQDQKDYQSLFANADGSIAAPTASLHFTPELLAKINEQKIETAQITLHVGPASFLPLWNDEDSPNLNNLTPGIEYYQYDARIIDLVAKKRESGGRIIPVGTTVVRALESIARESAVNKDAVRCDSLNNLIATDIFIKPGYKFNLVDGLVTNFHQPGTTHLLLVEALLGRDLLKRSYEYALANDFRFLSYGDGMLII
jgi:S-adenosylmethionine:tRNA ribosyltransferase-isomerase